MSRRVRTTVAVLLAGSGLSFSAGIDAARIDLRAAWGQSEAPAVLDRVAALGPPTLVVPVGPDQWFQPGGRNGGTELLIDYLARLALHDNAPLYVSDTWGRTSGGGNSDHHVTRTDSWALDVAVRGVQQPSPATETAAQRIASALGEPGWKGGDLTKIIAGYRFQLLWRVAGHFNHVHVGVRKVG